MKIRLYLDEDTMDGDLVHALRIRGVDVLTALDVGMIRRDDNEHLDYATGEGRSLYSYNVRDYQLLHTQYLMVAKSHAGIIVAQQQKYSVGEQMRRLSRLVASVPAEQMHNQMEFLGRW
jgi:hypothetical protein